MPEIVNPLTVIGLTPESLDELSDSQIMVLVGEFYKGVARIAHPDVTKDEKLRARFKEVRAAVDDLDVEALRSEAIAEMRRKVKRAKTSKSSSQQEESDAASLGDAVGNFLAGYVARQPIMPLRWTREAISIFQPPPWQVMVVNNLPHMVTTRMWKQEGRWLGPDTRTREVEAELFDLEYGDDGILRTYPLEEFTFDSRKTSPPAHVPEDWILWRASEYNCLYWDRREGVPPTVLEERLLGTIDVALLRLYLGGKQIEWAKGFLPNRVVDSSDLERATSGYPFHYLRGYLPYYRPELVITGMILSVNPNADTPEPVFRVLGQVHAMHVPAKAKKRKR